MLPITQKRCRMFLEDEHLKGLDNISKDLLKATETVFCVAKPGQQYVILCDASYYSSRFLLMLEDYLEPKDGMKNKHTHLYSTDHNYLMQVN